MAFHKRDGSCRARLRSRKQLPPHEEGPWNSRVLQNRGHTRPASPTTTVHWEGLCLPDSVSEKCSLCRILGDSQTERLFFPFMSKIKVNGSYKTSMPLFYDDSTVFFWKPSDYLSFLYDLSRLSSGLFLILEYMTLASNPCTATTMYPHLPVGSEEGR